MNKLKLSICIVALNEEAFLPNLLNNIVEQEYPHELIEIVLVDSGSTDHTKEIMESFKEQNKDFYSIQVLDNPKRTQAAGWNVAISNATGDAISRIDAHTILPKDYSLFVMKELDKGENVVGGIRPCIIEKETSWGKTLLAVENSLFGSSFNSSRHSESKQYVKTMFHATYKREVFEKVGLFNERLLRTEDNEMHYRIRRAGFKLCYNPQIVSYQYARNSLTKMMTQKYANGYWIGLTLGVCPGCISIYHLVPAAYVCGILFTTVLAIVGLWQCAVLMWSLYFAFCIANMMICIVREKALPHMLLLPALFLLLHVSYGVGTIIGVLSIPTKRHILTSDS